MRDVFESIVNTALFGLMPICGTRKTLSEADVTKDPLNGDPVPGVKLPLRRAEKRKPFAPSTKTHKVGSKQNQSINIAKIQRGTSIRERNQLAKISGKIDPKTQTTTTIPTAHTHCSRDNVG